MEPLPSVREQIRDQSGGLGGVVGKLLLLWILTLVGATLAWWQIDRIVSASDAFLMGEGWQLGGGLQLSLILTTLGIVIAVGFAAIAVMATDVSAAFVGTALLFAPMALFRLWEPLWIWWTLGPLAALILLNLIARRSGISWQVRWSPLRRTVRTTLWTLILIGLFAPLLVTRALQEKVDYLTPDDLRPTAAALVDRMPQIMVDFLLLELPASPAVVPPRPEPIPLPEEPVTSEPASPAAEEIPPPAEVLDITTGSSASRPAQPIPFTQEGADSTKQEPPKPPREPADPWATPSVSPETAATPEVVSLLPLEVPPAPPVEDALSRDDRIDRLALGMWHALSSHGDGYNIFPPLLAPMAGFALTLVMIPLTILGVIASAVIMGVVLWLMRRMDFVRCVTVRVEAPRYTLRGERPPLEGPRI